MSNAFPATEKAVKYGKNVYSRYKFANTKLAPVSEVTKVIEKHLPNIKTRRRNMYHVEPNVFNENLDDINRIVTQTGGIVAKPGITTELHFNPDITYNPANLEILSTTPRNSSRIVGMRIIKDLPSGTVISSDEGARFLPQILKK